MNKLEIFELMLRECRDAVERTVFFRISPRTDAEDVLQEVYLTAYRKFDTLADRSAFKAWVISIARNKCVDYYRKRASNMEFPTEMLSGRVMAYGRYGVREQGFVQEVLGQLAEKDQNILKLYYFQGMPQAEIARKLRIPLGTVKSRLYAARENFREAYTRYLKTNNVLSGMEKMEVGAEAEASGVGNHEVGEPEAKTSGVGSHEIGEPEAKASRAGKHEVGEPERKASGVGSHEVGELEAKASRAGKHEVGEPERKASGVGSHEVGEPEGKASGVGKHEIGEAEAKASGVGNHEIGEVEAEASGAGKHEIVEPKSEASVRGKHKIEKPEAEASRAGNRELEAEKTENARNAAIESKIITTQKQTGMIPKQSNPINQNNTGGDDNMTTQKPIETKKTTILPEFLPEYTVTRSQEPPFEPVWEELQGWMIVPRLGERLTWGLYEMPSRKRTEYTELAVVGRAQIHGIEGVEIKAVQYNAEDYYRTGSVNEMERCFVAQLTDTHSRYLAESHIEDGIRKCYTFLDGDSFTKNWGFGENNCGNEIHVKAKGILRREGNTVTLHAQNAKHGSMDVVGRYTVKIMGKSYDTVCVMDVESFDDAIVTESYIDRNGRTVLWRRFNRDDWAIAQFGGKKWSEMLPDNERLTVGGSIYAHWYDCISDYIL